VEAAKVLTTLEVEEERRSFKILSFICYSQIWLKHPHARLQLHMKILRKEKKKKNRAASPPPWNPFPNTFFFCPHPEKI
jgi:hypothetical protein